jgi:mRNA interferase RelE/StbE
MKADFRKSFVRDLKKITNVTLLNRISKSIRAVESADNVGEVPNCKKLAGAKDAFRIRIGDFRIGAIVTGGTFEFVRCLNRRDLYRYFP